MTISLDTTVAIALWGALTGTTAIVWDFIKWRKDRPCLEVSVSPNMQSFDHATRQLEPKQLIMVRAVNTGKRPAKVTHLVGYAYKSRIHRLLKMAPVEVFLVTEHLFGTSLPVLLEPACDWTGFLDRDRALAIAGDAVLYCGVVHTLAKKPVLARINRKALRPPETTAKD